MLPKAETEPTLMPVPPVPPPVEARSPTAPPPQAHITAPVRIRKNPNHPEFFNDRPISILFVKRLLEIVDAYTDNISTSAFKFRVNIPVVNGEIPVQIV